MARNRMIKVEFWDDEKLASIPIEARHLFIGLWNHADDYGVVRGHSSWLKNRIFPYDSIKPSIFEAWLSALEDIRVIIPFLSNEEKFYYIRSFTQHQTINKPSKTRNPAPPEDILAPPQEGYGSATTLLPSEREREREREREVKENYCAELETSSTPDVIFQIPLNTKNGDGNPEMFPIFQADIDQWENSFPAVDVMQELRKLAQWNLDNVKRRKTKRGIRNHISGWLAREQDKGGVYRVGKKPAVPGVSDTQIHNLQALEQAQKEMFNE